MFMFLVGRREAQKEVKMIPPSERKHIRLLCRIFKWPTKGLASDLSYRKMRTKLKDMISEPDLETEEEFQQYCTVKVMSLK